MAPSSSADLLQYLCFEHRQITHMWSELERTHRNQIGGFHPGDARLGDTTQKEFGQQIVVAMADHETLELDLLYPAASRAMNVEWAEQAGIDHAEFHELLAEIDGANPEDDHVFGLFSAVMTRTLAHFQEEEKILFPIMRLTVPSEELLFTLDSRRPNAIVPPPPPIAALEAGPATDTPVHGDSDAGADTLARAEVDDGADTLALAPPTKVRRRLLRR